MNLYKKNILIGVTGSIAIYRTLDLISLLHKEGASVKVILTKSALKFITKLSFNSVLGSNSVFTDKDFFADSLLHIELSRWADIFVISPTSANTIAKMANGVANNLLLNVYLAFNKQVAIAPAMNPTMWNHKCVVNNINTLKSLNVKVWGPYNGMVKCGDFGFGRFIDVEDLIDYIIAELYPKPLQNQKVVVTAGSTVEEIDKARFISNYSSGKMGYALASSAYLLGAEVTLVSGPSSLKKPLGCNIINVKSAEDMELATFKAAQGAHFLVMAAAVSDFKIANVFDNKLSKLDLIEKIKLTVNNDILAKLSNSLSPKPFCVGFALEYDDVINKAREKLIRKNADIIVGNEIGNNTGFNSDTNEVYIVTKDSEKKIPLMTKKELSIAIWVEILEKYLILE